MATVLNSVKRVYHFDAYLNNSCTELDYYIVYCTVDRCKIYIKWNFKKLQFLKFSLQKF